MKISLNKINLTAINICQILQNHNYQSFLVGGCVRDLLLDHNPKDYDICSNATPEQIMEIFPKNIPTGLKHGTITVIMGAGIENHFEITTFRTEKQYVDGRHPESVEFVQDIKLDLARRDFTINAMAVDPIANILMDPFNGIQDLKDKIIRSVGNPNDRFKEDGLRIMRAARFAARFGYEIEENTFAGMLNNLETIKLVAKERIKDELCKTLLTTYPFYGLNILKEAKVFQYICPLLKSNIEIKCTGNLETKIAALYHNVSDFNLVEEELNSLKFSNKEIKRIIFQLKALHMIHDFDKSAYIHFIAWMKNNSIDPWEESLNQFITLTSALNIDFKTILDKYQAVTVFARKDLQINGDDLIKLGIKMGPKIKSLLDKCYSEILINPINNNKEYLSNFINV